MGSFFDKTFIRGKNSIIYEKWVHDAAKDIGYTAGVPGSGVPVRILVYGDNTEWFGVDSPLMEAGSESAEVFARALSREFKAPALQIGCVDSDFAVCSLIDGVNGTESVACINRPYEGVELPPFDPDAWVAASKKKWKCKAEQFERVFSGEYVFAEDGLCELADLIFLPKEALSPEEPDEAGVYAREVWVMPQAQFDAAPIPRTLEERLAAYIDETFAGKLTGLGYKRFGGSSLRWHKVFGEDGKELISSIVFVVRYGHDINIMYGVQPVCCPLVLTDKYFPMHDWMSYWKEAIFEFPKHMGYNPMFEIMNGVDRMHPLNGPETIFPYINAFVPEQLDEVKDIPTCRRFVKKEFLNDRGLYSYTLAYRLFVEALLDGDEKEAEASARRVLAKHFDFFESFPRDQTGIEKQQIAELPKIFNEGGVPACLEALKKVRDANMRKLKKGGIE